MGITNTKQWIVKFERAALEFIAERTDLILDDGFPLRLEPCGKHGSECLRLTVGAIAAHIHWQTVRAETSAVEWLQTLLPKPVLLRPLRESVPQSAFEPST